MKRRLRLLPFCALALLILMACSLIHPRGRIQSTPYNPATMKADVIDSAMTWRQAIDGVAPECPQSILDQLQLMDVVYYGEDGKIHKGQLVIAKDLAPDIDEIFKLAYDLKFPITSVIPAADARYRKDGKWDDELTMEVNNTSAFNYRAITLGKKLSMHATGRAIDINPRQNPYIKGGVILPANGVYDPKVPGTLTADHPITKRFLSLGWTWGGAWDTRKDYQHFEK